MEIFNTLSHKKEELKQPRSRPLHLFVCGPTVYDYSHIGHARTYLVFDVFVRYLRSRGSRVFYLQNITNVDDKIITRARRENKNPLALAKFFENKYKRDMKALGVNNVTKYARATDFIPQIVRQVQTLIKKGYAYEIPGDGWYYNISKFKDYGKLSGRTALQAEDAVSRIDESVGKRNKGDFCLWKFAKPGEPSWRPAPEGRGSLLLRGGRPGWHIEDTAISEKYFGPQYDLHGGGLDLKFPHHEAEIAQQEAASDKKPFVKIWMHVGMLNVYGEKMAKSRGNFITIEDFLKKHSPNVLRWLTLAHHYRSPVNYTETLAKQAENSLQKLTEFLAKLDFVKHQANPQKKETVKARLLKAKKDFYNSLDNDFNTPKALAHLFDLTLEYQDKIWRLGQKDASLLKNHLEWAFQTLGLTLPKIKIPPQIKKLVRERELFRRNKQFIQADTLRKKAAGLGYEIQDTSIGPFVNKAR